MEVYNIIQLHHNRTLLSVGLTRSPGLTVDSVTLSLSGLGTGELSEGGDRTGRHALSSDMTNG